MYPNNQQLDNLIEERERTTIEHINNAALWPEPTGLRGVMRNVAIRLRGRDTQLQLERMWRWEAVQRQTRATSGW